MTAPYCDYVIVLITHGETNDFLIIDSKTTTASQNATQPDCACMLLARTRQALDLTYQERLLFGELILAYITHVHTYEWTVTIVGETHRGPPETLRGT